MSRLKINLEDTLQRFDLSGRELSRRTGVHRDTVGRYRSNSIRIISLDILEQFQAAIGCTFADLLAVVPDAPGTSTRPTPQGQRPCTVKEQPTGLPLPNGTRLPTLLGAMSRKEFVAWVDAWFDGEAQTLPPLPSGAAYRPPAASPLSWDAYLAWFGAWEAAWERAWEAARKGR